MTRAIEPDLLLRHAGAIRALALRVLGDADAANDVLQDTFVRAIVAPPRRASSITGWLRAVALGLARNRRRGDARRDAHERAYAREHTSTAYDSAGRAETLRRVVRAVLELDEPYRATVLQRYFEGATPAAIASREGVSVATVASRLQRAHGKLRERLERDRDPRDGGALAALASLIGGERSPIALASSWPLVSVGGLIVGTKTTVAIVALAAVGMIAWWWNPVGEVALPGSAVTDVERRSARPSPREGEVAELAVATLAHGAEREPSIAIADDSPSASPLAAAPFEFQVEFVPLDASQRPLASATVEAAPLGCVLNRMGTSEWDGRLRSTWRAFSPTLVLVVSAFRDGHGESGLRRVELAADRFNVVRLPLLGDVVAKQGGSLLLQSRGASWELRRSRVRVIDGRESPVFTLDPLGNGVFVDPWIGRPFAPANDASIARASSLHLLMALGYAEGVDGATSIGVGAAHTRPEMVRLDGHLLRSDGKPASGALITIATQAHAFRTDVHADDEGRFALEAPAGAAMLVVGGGDYDVVEHRLTLSAGDQAWSSVLDERERIAVRVLDRMDGPLGRLRIEAWTLGGNEFASSAITDAEGRAVLRGLDARDHRVLARVAAQGGSRTIAIELDSRAFPRADELVLRAPSIGATGELAAELERASGEALPEGELRVWRRDSGHGFAVEARANVVDGRDRCAIAIDGLPAGDYELEAGGASASWTSLGVIRVDAERKLDFGVARLSEAAHARLELADGARVELVRGAIATVRDGVRVRSPDFEAILPARVGIPLGLSEVSWTRHAGAPGANDGEPPRFAERGRAEIWALDGVLGFDFVLELPAIASGARAPAAVER